MAKFPSGTHKKRGTVALIPVEKNLVLQTFPGDKSPKSGLIVGTLSTKVSLSSKVRVTRCSCEKIAQ
jgi:hypothetical protein